MFLRNYQVRLFTFVDLAKNHLWYYPTTWFLSNWWSFGMLTGFCLLLQILTGIWLALYYSVDPDTAFLSLQYIMRETYYGWLIRYMHMNGATMCFIMLYIHVAKGLYLRTFWLNPNVWVSGVVLLLLFMASAFVGYTLTWSQMGYWAAIVITNLVTSIPYIGSKILYWFWGGEALLLYALKRFFVLHFFIPLALFGALFVHLNCLHKKGSNTSFQLSAQQYITFGSFFFVKDVLIIVILCWFYWYLVFIEPYLLNHVDSFVVANTMLTPVHIVPEWYFLSYYAMLRSFPNKILGFLVLILSLIAVGLLQYYFRRWFDSLFISLPNTIFSSKQNLRKNFLIDLILFYKSWSPLFGQIYLINFWVLLVNLVVLGWIGTESVSEPFITIGMWATVIHFFNLIFLSDLLLMLSFLFKLVFIKFFGRVLFINLFEWLKTMFKHIIFFIQKRGNYFIFYMPASFQKEPVQTVIVILLASLILVIFLLLAVAYFTLAERKILAKLQRREGPAAVGLWGFFQPLTDGLKLFIKEVIYPSRSNNWLFWGGPVFVLSASLTNWALIAFDSGGPICNANLGLIAIFVLAALNTYAIVLSSWASNSKYSLLGCLRSVSQYLSYEILIGFSILLVGFMAGSFKLEDIINAQRGCFFMFPLFPVALIFLIVILAETGRTPFDIPEAESELTGGYHTEYSGVLFSFFLVAEYSNILLMSCVWVTLFFGGWLPLFSFLEFIPGALMFISKALLVSFFIVFVRAKLPRYRYDQLLSLSWKHLLVFFFGFTVLFFCIIINLDLIPTNSYLIFELSDLSNRMKIDQLAQNRINAFKEWNYDTVMLDYFYEDLRRFFEEDYIFQKEYEHRIETFKYSKITLEVYMMMLLE